MILLTVKEATSDAELVVQVECASRLSELAVGAVHGSDGEASRIDASDAIDDDYDAEEPDDDPANYGSTLPESLHGKVGTFGDISASSPT